MAHVFYCCLTARCCAHLHDRTPPFKLNRTLTDCLASREELSTKFLEDMLEVHQTGVLTFKEHAFLMSKECFIHFLSHTKQTKFSIYILNFLALQPQIPSPVGLVAKKLTTSALKGSMYAVFTFDFTFTLTMQVKGD